MYIQGGCAKQATKEALQAEKKAQLEVWKTAKQVPKARSIPTTAARASKNILSLRYSSPKRVVIVGSGCKTRTRAVVPLSRYE